MQSGHESQGMVILGGVAIIAIVVVLVIAFLSYFLRKLNTPEAKKLISDITATLRLLLTSVGVLVANPDDIAARDSYAATANKLYGYSEDVTMLLP